LGNKWFKVNEIIILLLVSVFSGSARDFVPFICKFLNREKKKEMAQKIEETAKKRSKRVLALYGIPDKAIDCRRIYAIKALGEADFTVFMRNLLYYFAKKRVAKSAEVEFLLAREDCPDDCKMELLAAMKSFASGLSRLAKAQGIKAKRHMKPFNLKIDRRLEPKLAALDKKFAEDAFFRNLIESSVFDLKYYAQKQ
jgi:hypothetical protein